MNILENLYFIINPGQEVPNSWLEAWGSYQENDSINEQIRIDLEGLESQDTCIKTLCWVIKNNDLRQTYINIKTIVMLFEISWIKYENHCGFCLRENPQCKTGYCQYCMANFYSKIANITTDV